MSAFVVHLLSPWPCRFPPLAPHPAISQEHYLSSPFPVPGNWWDFSVLPTISPAKHYKLALRCQQIYDIDLNLQDMKSKYWTVLFALCCFLACTLQLFNSSKQARELETYIFTNWKLRYFPYKHVIPGAEGEAETCENIPGVLPAILSSQPKQHSWGSEWDKGLGIIGNWIALLLRDLLSKRLLGSRTADLSSWQHKY